MESKQHVPIEEMDFFRTYVELADRFWAIVEQWRPLAADTVGQQLVRAADAIGANLVEGDGRFHDADSLHFFVIARASARETRYWVQRAVARRLIPSEEGVRIVSGINDATRQLNALIR